MFTHSSLLSSLVILITITLTLYQVHCLYLFHLALFLDDLSYSFIWNISLSPHFCLTFCVCFYVLGSSAMSPHFEGMALFSRFPVGPRNGIVPNHQGQVLQGVPCVCCLHSLFVAGPWLLGAVNSNWMAARYGHNRCGHAAGQVNCLICCKAWLRCRVVWGFQWNMPLGVSRLEEGFKMAPISARFGRAEQDGKMAATSVSVPGEKPSFLLPLQQVLQN